MRPVEFFTLFNCQTSGNTILKRQVQYARSTKQVDGFCIFSYEAFTRASAKKEIANLVKILK